LSSLIVFIDRLLDVHVESVSPTLLSSLSLCYKSHCGRKQLLLQAAIRCYAVHRCCSCRFRRWQTRLWRLCDDCHSYCISCIDYSMPVLLNYWVITRFNSNWTGALAFFTTVALVSVQ